MLKRVLFYDKFDNECSAMVKLNNSLLTITAYNENADKIGYLEAIVDTRIFLNTVECDRNYYGLGIGSELIKIFEYLYKEYTGIVLGVYAPYNIALNTRENDEIGKSFYTKNGYQVVSKREYVANKELYPGLDINDFIEAKRIFDYSLIYKTGLNKDNDDFKEVNGELVENTKMKMLLR